MHIINTNIEEKIKRKRYPERLRFMTKAEFPEFKEKCHNLKSRRYAILFYIMLFTGVKSKLILSAKWQDLDFVRKIWHIAKESNQGKEGYQIFLSQQVHDLLLELMAIQYQHYLQRDSKYLYPSSYYNKHITSGCINAVWNKFSFNNLHINDLRYSFAHHASLIGIPEQTTNLMLGLSYRPYNMLYSDPREEQNLFDGWQKIADYMENLLSATH
jgi:integrase